MSKAGPQVRIVEVDEYKKQPRRMRRPSESFNIKYKPQEICPFLFHPVLPGETLDAAFLQSRVVSDPIANNLIGWWQEYHFFYVPIRALTVGTGYQIAPADLNSLFLDPTYNIATANTAYYGAASNTAAYYEFKAGMTWQSMLYGYLVTNFFRDEGESATPLVDVYSCAQIDQTNWAHSLKEESAGSDDVELPGQDELEELDILPGFTTIYAQWELMRDQGMTQLSYADYIRSYGITPPPQVQVSEPEGEPQLDAELIRTVRKWTYPTLAPQQGDAESSSVVYWSIAERITKRRFFGEPGFIVGLTVTKPKLYLGNQMGHFIGLLDTAVTWLPAVLNHLPYTSVRENLDSATDGILQGGDEDYWLDMKDGFIHGGQFLNHTLGAHAPALPVAATLQKKYPTEAMMDALFTVTDGTQYIRQDGVVHFDILGRLKDATPLQ